MNINLIYQNNSFNFDLRKDASIRYLEDLASKLINKDKASFNLSYKDNILSEGPNTLLKDILKTETNVHITISPKVNRSGGKIKKILPKLQISNQSISNTESIETKNNLIMNDTELSQSFSENSIKVLQHLSKHNFGKIKNQKYEYFTQNKVFEEIYNSKENKLLKFLKILSQKIKEYDDFLYKNYKKSFNRNNHTLLLFEKNVMNFKDRQIKFIKKLIEFFDNNEKDFLDEFYKELNKYDNKEYTIEYNSNINKKKKIEDNRLSPIIKIEKNYSNSHKDLPLLIKNNNININNQINQLCLSQKIIKNNRNDDKELREEKSLFARRNRLQLIPNININSNNNSENKQDLLYNNNIGLNIKEINNKFGNKSNIKASIENTTKANSNQSEKSITSKAPDRQVNSTKKITSNIPKQKISSNNINNNNNNNIQNNNQIDIQNEIQDNQNNKQDNAQNNLENNTQNNIHNDLLLHLHQKLKKDEKNKKEKKKKNIIEKMKEREQRRRRVSTVENIEYNKNKVSSLFEISESFINENKKSDNSSSSNSSEEESETSRKRKEYNINHYFNGYDEIKNLKKKYESKSSKKSNNYTNVKNPKIGYLIKVKNRKMNQRIKRLGNNVNDFLI